ncbi:MAG: hypothetical protein ABSA85_14875 [Terracidiphilus sp.]
MRKLVVDGHVNVAERQSLGVVYRQEVKDIVNSILRQDGAFPNHGATKAVYEGATLAQVDSNIQITWERPSLWEPFTVAERRIETFAAADAAIERFIDSEWRTGIDGIRLH